jgi:hypothetical protein
MIWWRGASNELTMNNLQKLLIVIAVAAASNASGDAFGHGSPMHIDGISGGLVVSGGLSLAQGYATMAFDPSEEGGLDFPGLTVRTDVPGFDVTNVPEGATFQLEILGRPDHSQATRPERWLWYWDPTTDLVADAANDPDFQFRRKDLQGSLSFDQYTLPATSVLTVTESLTPDSHQHYLRYELDNSPAAAFGVYGVFARALSPGFEPSTPFLMAFGYGVSVDDFAVGAATINAAAGLAGDFDVDGDVDGGDFLAWQRSLGAASAGPDYLSADATLDGVVTVADLARWRAEYGRTVVYPPTTATAAGAAAPESTGTAMATSAAIAWLAASTARRRRQNGLS